MKKFLVTGGSGFVGAHLVRKLLSEGNEVACIVRPSSNLFRIESLLPKITLHVCDLANLESLKKTIEEIAPQVIFHCAVSRGDDEAMLNGTVVGSFNLMMATRDLEYEYYLHIGSSLEHGPRNAPLQETNAIRPSTMYGAMKACASLLAEQFALQYQKPLSVLRLFSVYGPLEPSCHLIPVAIDAALHQKDLKLTSQGFVRDFIYVEDVVDACLMCWKKKIVNEILNVGTGVQTSNEEAVEWIEEITGKSIRKHIGSYTPHPTDTTHWVADISKIESLVGWTPRNSLKEGLEKTVDYTLNQHCSTYL